MSHAWPATEWIADADASARLLAEGGLCDLALLATFDPTVHHEAKRSTLRSLSIPMRRDDGREEWMLTEVTRVEALSQVLRGGGLDALAARRRALAVDYDSDLQHMLDAFVFQREMPLDQQSEDELVASTHVWRWISRALTRVDLFDPHRFPSLEAIQGRIALNEVTRPVRKLVANGVFGRETELQRLHDWVASSRGDSRSFVIRGIGGMGKSTLVARFVMDLFEAPKHWPDPPAWAYLDFDRPALEGLDPFAIVEDIGRQIAAQFPRFRAIFDERRTKVRRTKRSAGLESYHQSGSFREAVSNLAWAFSSLGPDWPVVIVMDTFEVAQRTSSGEEEIFELVQAILDHLPSSRVVMSGRAPMPVFERSMPDERVLDVQGLDEESAIRLLQHLVARDSGEQLDGTVARAVIRHVGASPLSLRLAAKVLAREDLAAVIDASQRARLLGLVREELVRGFLYRRILDHLHHSKPDVEHQLRSVARASLAVRLITPEVIAEVLLPALNLPEAGHAPQLYDLLTREASLVDDVGGALALREDLRRPALAALRFEDPSLVERVHDRARSYYGTHPRVERAAVELVYHRLACGEPPESMGLGLAIQLMYSGALASILACLDDLPKATADVLRSSAGSVPALTALSKQADWERAAFSRADAALRAGDLERTREVLRERPQRLPTSELFAIEARLEDIANNLELALSSARREIEAANLSGNPKRTAAAVVQVALLLERLRRPEEALVTLKEGITLAALESHWELHLELHLNSMNLAERAGGDSDSWTAGLEARRLMTKVGRHAIATSVALVRLVAAALGREEPGRIIDALTSVGLGQDAPEERVRALATAIVHWDKLGDLASEARVVILGPEPPLRAWIDRLSILGRETGELLRRLWRFADPPGEVREAIRAFYLWWGLPPARVGQLKGLPNNARGLKNLPSPEGETSEDFELNSLGRRELINVIAAGYGSSISYLELLVTQADLGRDEIQWSAAANDVIQQVVSLAARRKSLQKLLVVLLDEDRLLSLRPQLEGLLHDPKYRAT